MFNKNSMLVRVWADAVKKGDKRLSEIPDLSNLVTVVTTIIEEAEQYV